ncbi:hypothetical protein HYPGJ_31008 [Hyphomicrobium sp. GJ21]|nr:hypothetical protein HYPGJ_31008 [Hyphomicrobium sp. GJ21]
MLISGTQVPDKLSGRILIPGISFQKRARETTPHLGHTVSSDPKARKLGHFYWVRIPGSIFNNDVSY